MKSLLNTSKALFLLMIIIFSSCKKDKNAIDVDFMQYYLAGKLTQQGAEIPFALLPISATKALFVRANEKSEVDYTIQNNKLSTKINGADFSCTIKNSKVENVVVNSNTVSVRVAALNKKQDATLAFAGKIFEAAMKNLNGVIVHNNYYFKFNADQLNYTSNPTPGNYLIRSKTYELLADGCMYNELTKTFGVMLNNSLEIETKLENDFLLFSGISK